MCARAPSATLHAMEAKNCTLRAAAGAGVEACPGGECAFWDRGCLVDRFGVPLEPHVSRHLLDLRLALEEGRNAEERAARARLHELLNLGGK